MTAVQTKTDSSLGFGLAEMAYLLHLQPTAESRASASWLRLSEESGDQDLIAAGLSSLLARGLAFMDGIDVRFDQRVDVVAYTLANAQRWTQLDLLVDAQGRDSVLHVESDRTTLLFQPRTMLSWFALPQDPGITPEAAETYIITEHLNTNPDGGVRLRSGQRRTTTQLLVRKDARGWVHAVAIADAVGAEAVAKSHGDLAAAVAAFRSETGSGAADGN